MLQKVHSVLEILDLLLQGNVLSEKQGQVGTQCRLHVFFQFSSHHFGMAPCTCELTHDYLLITAIFQVTSELTLRPGRFLLTQVWAESWPVGTYLKVMV